MLSTPRAVAGPPATSSRSARSHRAAARRAAGAAGAGCTPGFPGVTAVAAVAAVAAVPLPNSHPPSPPLPPGRPSHWRHCRSTGATTASAQTRLPHPWLTVAATRWPPRQMRTPRHRPSGLAQTGYETLLPERPPLGSPGRVGRTERRPPSIPRRGRGDHRRRRSGRRRVFVGQRGADALEIRGHRRHGLRRNQHKRHPVPRTSPSRTRPRPCIIGAIARNGSYRDPGSSFGGSTRLFGSTIRPDPGEHGGAP